MENPRTIPEIRLITEGILAVANFHFSLEDWELTKAGRKARKEERKMMKRMEKTKKGEESTQRDTISEEQKKKNCDIETVVNENVLETFVASFCKGIIQKAIHELLEEEGGSAEAICNIKAVVGLEEEIKYKIESLEKGEGDTGRAVTVADLRDNDMAKGTGAQSCEITTSGYLEVEPDGNLEVEPDGNLEVEPEVWTETSLEDEQPIETRQNTIKSSGEIQMKKSEDNKVEDSENDNTKLSPKDAKAEKKREKKERKKKKKLEAEQIKATKKYFEKIDGAMRRRSLMLSVYWQKTVEENENEQKRQEKMRRKELKKERKEQKAQEKKKRKESKPKDESAIGIDLPVYAIEGQQESCFNRIQNVKVDQECNSQDGGHKKAKRTKHEKTKLNIGSRIIRFLGRLYSEDVF